MSDINTVEGTSNQLNSMTGKTNDLFSPVLPDASMAILSPPSSRYAFDPNLNINGNLNENESTNNSILSPLLATVSSPPISELNFSNLNLISSPPPGYGTENDIPAFLPKTEILLNNFTNDLKIFNNWIQSLNIEEKKIAISLFIDSNGGNN
ncbi:hypothetical protein C6P40_004672, partial [Pichia californica]